MPNSFTRRACKKPGLLVLLAGTMISVVAFAQFARGDTRSNAAVLSHVSAHGLRVPVARSTRRMLAANGGGTISLLRAASGRNVYRISGTPRGTCYGSGPSGLPAILGVEMCGFAPPFPSADRPVLDFSVIDVQPSSSSIWLGRIEGVASDGVTAVSWFDAAGGIVVRVPVEGNVYSLRDPPLSPVAGYVATDASGRELYRFVYAKE